MFMFDVRPDPLTQNVIRNGLIYGNRLPTYSLESRDWIPASAIAPALL
jgi:hypothetical protein